MGATAVISSSASGGSNAVSATVTSMLSPVGAGVGGIAVAVALVVILAYLNVESADPDGDESVRQLLLAVATPLGATFLAIVAFRTLQLI